MVTISKRAEIAPPGNLFLRESTAEYDSRLLHHFRRETVRQMVLADDDLDIDAEIVGMAQNFDHASHRAAAIFGKSSNSTLTIMPSRSSTLFT